MTGRVAVAQDVPVTEDPEITVDREPAIVRRSTAGIDAIEVDRASPIPLYFQLISQLEGAIREGVIPYGTRLESEHELAERLGVSRLTLRRAFGDLVAKGLLVRRRNTGTQVVRPVIDEFGSFTSLYDGLVRAGRQPTTTVLVLEEVLAPPFAAASLRVEEGAPVCHLRRLRFADGVPLAIMENWLPVGIAPLAVDGLEQRGLFDLLRKAGVYPARTVRRISARLALAHERRTLEVLERPAIAIVVERQTSDASGRVFECGRYVFPASRHAVEVTSVEP